MLENSIVLIDMTERECAIIPPSIDIERLEKANTNREAVELQCWICPRCAYMDSD
jgi:hypothetical protein